MNKEIIIKRLKFWLILFVLSISGLLVAPLIAGMLIQKFPLTDFIYWIFSVFVFIILILSFFELLVLGISYLVNRKK